MVLASSRPGCVAGVTGICSIKRRIFGRLQAFEPLKPDFCARVKCVCVSGNCLKWRPGGVVNLQNCIVEHLKLIFEGVGGIGSCSVVCVDHRVAIVDVTENVICLSKQHFQSFRVKIN